MCEKIIEQKVVTKIFYIKIKSTNWDCRYQIIMASPHLMIELL